MYRYTIKYFMQNYEKKKSNDLMWCKIIMWLSFRFTTELLFPYSFLLIHFPWLLYEPLSNLASLLFHLFESGLSQAFLSCLRMLYIFIRFTKLRWLSSLNHVSMVQNFIFWYHKLDVKQCNYIELRIFIYFLPYYMWTCVWECVWVVSWTFKNLTSAHGECGFSSWLKWNN